MANNLIQIKRSTATATPSSLAAGELAYSNTSKVLFIGSTDAGATIVPIGGARSPGTLTANQALVANSTSGIDKVIVANAVITSIWANGAGGATGDILFSNSTGGLHWASPGQAGVNVDATYTWSNVHTFNANVNGNTVNASVFTTSGVTINTTGVWTTATVNAATHSVGTAFTANSTLVNAVAVNVVNQINTATLYATTSANIASAAQINSTGVWSTGQVNAASHTVGSVFVANSTKITFTGANVDAASAVLAIRDINVSGNLIVSGTVTTIDTQQLVVNDNIIQMADNNTTTDAIDTGWFSPAGNATHIWYSGLARRAAVSTNSAPYFWLFGSNTNPNTATTIDITANSTTALLQAYLIPYGTGGAFVANSSVVNITANSTHSVALVANSLTLSTALGYASGGTGQSSWAAGDLLYASATNTLSKLGVPGAAANGQVLQITNNLPAYGTLDGGTF